jgi:AI-2 transport protein TqsA
MKEPPPPGPTAEAPSLATASRWIIILVGAFFLLRELGPILKPLFLAVLLAYVILPFHLMVKKWVPGRLSLVASAILSLLLILLLTAGIQASIRTVAEELPALTETTQETLRRWQQHVEERYPATWKGISELAFQERPGENPVRDFTTRLVGLAADTVTTAAVVGLYLMFLLLEAGRFPDKVRKAFTKPRAERILEMIEGINRGIAHYLLAKVKASLILAMPVFIILFVFRLPFAVIWGVLTFFCNFVPYLGSLVGYSLPVLFAVASFGVGWESITIAILLLAIHLTTASVVEPAIIGKAVGVSPVAILFALAFWGSLWGVTGMLLAVPLTVMIKIIGEHMEATRPVARLLAEQ